VVAQANVSLDERLPITTELVNCRQAGNFVLKSRDEVDYVDVSPKQLVSVAASLIPFLENDDANRALMGSNMQRQAVPLIRGEAPLVGTGMERVTARDSGAVVFAAAMASSIRSTPSASSCASSPTTPAYSAAKWARTSTSSSNSSARTRTPASTRSRLVRVGDRVKKGQVLADGPCTERGELALGRNVLVAFVPWRGYNFEDAILVSEKLVKDDYYTSIHIEEYEIEARDTKLGPEEVTRDIPNISESFLRNLDESGVIRIGATVRRATSWSARSRPRAKPR
jgi:DNA-directed RNA polymerase subunit beta